MQSSAVPPSPPFPQSAQGFARASLFLGVFSAMGGGVLLAPPLLAVIFGHIALGRAAADPARRGRGLAIGGLATGYFGIAVFVVGLLVAMAFPAFHRVRDTTLRRMMANDVRRITNTAQVMLLEAPETPVWFTIDPATGRVGGPLAATVPKVTPGTVAVDGIFDDAHDSIALKNPGIENGKVFHFDIQGMCGDGLNPPGAY